MAPNIQNETTLLKQVTNPKDLKVWKKLLIKKNDLVMNFDTPSENYLIRKHCGQSPEVSQLETAGM